MNLIAASLFQVIYITTISFGRGLAFGGDTFFSQVNTALSSFSNNEPTIYAFDSLGPYVTVQELYGCISHGSELSQHFDTGRIRNSMSGYIVAAGLSSTLIQAGLGTICLDTLQQPSQHSDTGRMQEPHVWIHCSSQASTLIQAGLGTPCLDTLQQPTKHSSQITSSLTERQKYC